MSRTKVRIIGGPLNGNYYDLNFELGACIKLYSPAGASLYQFEADDQHEPAARYVGPASPS